MNPASNRQAVATMPRQGGFTLIELMVTLSVMGILTALAGPPVAEFIASQRLRAMSSDLNLALVQTRSEAIKRNTNVRLRPIDATKGWASGWRILDPSDSTDTQFLAEWATKGDSVVTPTPSNLAEIEYRPNGRVKDSSNIPSFQITAQTTTSVRCVGISTSGKPYSKVKVGSSC